MHWLWEMMEAPVTDVASLRRRTNLLVAIHLVLAGAGLALLALVLGRIRTFVIMTQRSNIETLLLGFVVVFVLYLLVTTAPGTAGAVTIVGLRLGGRDRAQRRLQARAARRRRETKKAYLNVVVRGPQPGAIEVPIADDVGSLGTLRLDGGEVALVDVPSSLSASSLALAVTLLAEVGQLDGTDSAPRIVAWAAIDPEGAERYGSQVRAFCRLEQTLGTPLWPAVHVDAAAVARLAQVVRAATPALREDVLLPDIEYSAEFTIPIIPEPIPFMQIKRSQEHADPIATMGCATLVLLMMLGILAWVVVYPPWLPGR